MLPTALRRSTRASSSRRSRLFRAASAALRQVFSPTAVIPSHGPSAAEPLESRVFLSAVHGAVFVATNHNNSLDATEPGNEVVMYNRSADGTLTLAGRFDTGGQGSGPSVRFAGDGLGAAHSVQLSESKKFLFVTNAGSDNVSVFRVSRTGLELTDVEPTPDFPNSVTQRGGRVYVLSNDGGDGAISGYTFSNGELTPLSNSKRSINANQDANRPDTLFNQAEVAFTPNGKFLVVSIKDGPAAGAIDGVTPTGPGRILTFSVDASGRPSQTFRQENFENRGPFGFSFDKNGNLITSFFVGGPNLTASAGSFRINNNGSLSPISKNVVNGQLDSCWIENNGKYAWTANYSSGTISSYKIGANGSLTLLQAVAGTINDLPRDGVGQPQGGTPLDIRVSPNGRFLYDVLPGNGVVAGWRINPNTGALTKIGEFGNLHGAIAGDVPSVEFGPGGSPAGIDIIDYDTPFNPPVVATPAALNVLYVNTNDPRKGRNAILAFRRHPDTGELTPLEGGHVFYTDGTGYENVNDRIGPDDHDQEVVASPDRKFLFTVNQGSDSISVFRINGDGTLRLVEGAPTQSGGKQPVSLGIANNGKTLVVVNKGDQDPGGGGGTVRPNYTSFRISSEGKLSRIANSTITIGAGDSPTQALISRDGKFVFSQNFLADQFTPPPGFPNVPPFSSELETLRIDANGRLTRAPGSPVDATHLSALGPYTLGLIAHPTQNVVYAGYVVEGRLGVFSYDSDGLLDFERAIPTTGGGICWLRLNKAANRLYVTNFATNSVGVFDTSDALHPVEIQDFKLAGPKLPQSAPGSPAPFNVVTFQESLSPSGGILYVLEHEQEPDNDFPQGNRVHALRVGADGKLSEVASSPTVLPIEFVPARAHPMGLLAL